jgi:Holliday junction resolvase RusA-like endonuclease
MYTEDNLETENKAYQKGINPFFGEWKEKFEFEPISYANKSNKKEEFKTSIQSKLNNKFIYDGEIKVTIILYLNEEKMLESPAYGDLDNYAKSICDSLKGKNGIMIDDCQIQSLEISWIDIPEESYFEIEIKSLPDKFISSDFSLYEMSDKLYYPIPNEYWENGNYVKSTKG